MNSDVLKELLSGQTGSPTELVVRALSGHGAVSTAQISHTTGLARSTVSTTLSDLRRSGMVVEVASKVGGLGRPALAHTLNPQAGTCVGVLLGLGEIQVIVADVAHNVLSDVTVHLEEDYQPADAKAVISNTIERTYAANGILLDGLLGVGFAVSGPLSPSGHILRASVLPTWAGVDLRATFQPMFQRPIFADNESNCSALAEMMWGAARGVDNFVLFKIDLGVGGAIVLGGRVWSGVSGSAGEFGHMVIEPDGDLCRCGNRGCLELYASARAPLAVASRRLGRPCNMKEFVQRAREGDIGFRRLLEDTAHTAGRGLGILGTILNPELFVISGGLALAGELLAKPLQESYERHTLVRTADGSHGVATTRFVLGQFLENDDCMGAVGLVLRDRGRLA